MAPRWWVPGTALLLGLASLGLLASFQYLHDRLIYRDSQWRLVLSEFRTTITSAHLWVEEYVTGDAEVHEDVVRSHDRAGRLLAALLEGGDLLAGEARIAPLRDPALRTRVLEVTEQAGEFGALSKLRMRGRENSAEVGPGTSSDQKYDLAFAELLARTDELARVLADRQSSRRVRAAWVFRTIPALWALIVGLVAAALWHGERRRAAAERSLHESQSRIAQAQKMEVVGRLAGGLAHDINNYLGAIRAQAELATVGAAEDAPLRPRVQSILRSVDRASSLIERLLTFGRREQIEPRTLELNRVLGELADVLKRLVGERVALRLRLSPEPWSVFLDPLQLERLLANLAVNAREAMSGEGTLSIETSHHTIQAGDPDAHLVPAPGQYVALAVSDTGSGIPPELLARVFEPFFTTKAGSGNSGLGLSTVYGIVEQGGGRIWVESESGRGSTFRVFLPRALPGAAEPRARRTPEEGPRVGLRILLADDDDEMREASREILEAVGYQVVVSASGLEAFEAFRAAHVAFDGVVTDLVMPGLDGARLAEQLRELDPGIPILFISGHGNQATVPRLGGVSTDFLPKPFSSKELLTRVRTMLARRIRPDET